MPSQAAACDNHTKFYARSTKQRRAKCQNQTLERIKTSPNFVQKWFRKMRFEKTDPSSCLEEFRTIQILVKRFITVISNCGLKKFSKKTNIDVFVSY